MPKKGRIDDLFDIVALTNQRDKVLKEIIDKFIKAVDQANLTKIDLKNASKPSEILKGTEELIKKNKVVVETVQQSNAVINQQIQVQQEQVDSNKQVTASTDEKVIAQKEENAQSEVTVQQTKEQVAAEDQLLLSAIQNEIAMKKLAQAKRELNAEFNAGNITEEAYAQRLLEIKKSEDALTASNDEIIESLKKLEAGMKSASDAGEDEVESGEKIKKTGDAVIETIYERIKAQQAQNSAVSITKEQIDNQIESEEKLLRAAVNNELILKQYAAAKRQLEIEFKKGTITEEQYVSTLIDLKKATNEVSAEQKFVTSALKATQAQLSAAPGSIDKMAARLNLMRLTFKAMSDEQKNSDIGKEFERQTEQLANDLNDAKKRIGDFSSNVGRYAESLEGLFSGVRKELARLKAEGADLQTKFQNLTPQDQQGKPGFNLSAQINQNIVAQQKLEKVNQIGFKTNQTYARTVAVLNKEYQNLATTSGISTEALEAFEKELAKARIESGDLREKIAAMSSETRGLDLLTGTISGIADTFQVASGTAALFGADSEDVQRSLQKLIAIQGVANGIRGIANEITKDGSALNLIATGVQKFFQDALGLSTKKIQENTAAKIENAAVTEELAAAESGASAGAVATQGADAVSEASQASVAASEAKTAASEKSAAAELKDAAATEVNVAASNKAAASELKDAAATEVNAAASNKSAIAETKDTVATEANVVANKAHAASEIKDAAATEANAVATKQGVVAKEANVVATEANATAAKSNAAATLLESASTKAATVGQRIYAIAVGQSTGALRVLRLTLLSLTGVGLLVGIGALIYHFTTLSEAQKKAAETQKTLLEINKKAAESASQDVARLITIKDKLNDLNIPLEERTKIAKEYNKTADEAYKIDLKQIDNLDLINEKIAKQNELILKRAIGLAATAKLAEVASEFINNQLDLETLVNKTGKSFDVIVEEAENFNARISKVSKKVSTGGAFGIEDSLDKGEFEKAKKFFKNLSDTEVFAILDLVKKRQESQKKLDDANKILAPLISTESIIGGTGTPEAKDISDQVNSLLEEARKAYFEHSQKIIQDRIDANNKIIADDKATFEERSVALKEFYSDSKLLLKNQLDFELGALDRQEAEAKKKAEKDIEDPKKRGELIAAIEKSFDAKRQAANDANDEREEAKNREVSEKVTVIRLSALKKFITEREKLQKADEEKNKDLFEIDTAQIQLDYDILIQQEDAAFAERKKKADGNFRELQKLQEEHDATILRLNAERDRKLLLRQIQQAEDELKLMREKLITTPEGPETDDANREIAKQEIKLAKLKSDLNKVNTDEKIKSDEAVVASSKKSKEQIVKDLEEISNVARQVFDIVGGFVRANAEREKNKIQEQIDLLDQKKAKDIEVANQTIANEEQKAAAILVIEKEAEAQKQLLEIKKRQAQERQARFDKAANIAAIIQETALAVIRALGDKTTPSIFGRIGGAAVIGAIGAAKLAVAIATPIPKYAEGVGEQPKDKIVAKSPAKRDDAHPGGPAVVGERKDGIPELVEEPSGKTYIVRKPTLIEDLPKGSRVIPLTVANKKFIDEEKDRVNKEVAAYKNGIGLQSWKVKPIFKTESTNTTLKRKDVFSEFLKKIEKKSEKVVDVIKPLKLKMPTVPDYSKHLVSMSLTKVPEFKVITHTEGSDKVVRGLRKVEKAIEKIPQPIIKGEGRFQVMTRNGHSYREYLDKNL